MGGGAPTGEHQSELETVPKRSLELHQHSVTSRHKGHGGQQTSNQDNQQVPYYGIYFNLEFY